MKGFISWHIHATSGRDNSFYSPAASEAVTEMEKLLGVQLPGDYKEFLYITNGFEGFINNFYAIFHPVEEIFKYTQLSCATYFPWAVKIGGNGGGEMFVLDKRQTPLQFGLLPAIADDNDFIPLGDTFKKFVERLYNDTAFE